MTTIVDLRYCTPDEKYRVCRAYSRAFNRTVDLGWKGIDAIRSIRDRQTESRSYGLYYMPWFDKGDRYYSAKTFINLGSL